MLYNYLQERKLFTGWPLLSSICLPNKFSSKGLGIFHMKTTGNMQSWEYDKVFVCDSLIQGIIPGLRMQDLNIETGREEDRNLKQVPGLHLLS